MKRKTAKSVIPIGGKHPRLLHIPQRSRIIKHQSFLKKLYKTVKSTNRPDLAHVLQKASPSEIRAISETSQNLLKRTYPKTDKRFLKRLLPFKSIIRKLANPKTTVPQKRQVLLKQNLQSGGLPFLVPLLAPILGSLISAGIQSTI